MEIVIESDRLNAPLWYNPMISKDPLFEPELFENSVITPIDILTTEGKLLTSEEIKLYFKTYKAFGGHGGRVVTLSPPTSVAGVRFLARPQVGKLVVACHWSTVYSREP